MGCWSDPQQEPNHFSSGWAEELTAKLNDTNHGQGDVYIPLSTPAFHTQTLPPAAAPRCVLR